MRDQIVIIGSGLMGPGIAAVSALAGNKTVLLDRDPEIAREGKKNALLNIQELRKNQLATPEAAAFAEQNIICGSDMQSACRHASLVIEAVTENLPLKQDIFCELDSILPIQVPILSNTSGLRITEIAAKMRHPQRALTAHFWFPAHLVPLVEVVIGEHSNPKLADDIKALLQKWGKIPVIVKKDLNGQLANRILQAVIREAVNIVEMGIAEPEDVDTAVKAGMGIRMPVWGPLEHIEAVGLDLAYSVQQSVLPQISGSSNPSVCLKKKVENGELGYKTSQGFYDWTKKDMPQLMQNRNDFIIMALKHFKTQS